MWNRSLVWSFHIFSWYHRISPVFIQWAAFDGCDDCALWLPVFAFESILPASILQDACYEKNPGAYVASRHSARACHPSPRMAALLKGFTQCLIGWTNPIWKICSSNSGSFPQCSGWKEKIFELPPPTIAYSFILEKLFLYFFGVLKEGKSWCFR